MQQQLAQKINQATVNHDLSLTEQGGIPWDEETSLSQEIQRHFSHLQDLISSRLPSVAIGPSQKAVVTRYRDILSDLRQDFDKSKQSVVRAKERKELFGSSSGASMGGEGNDPAMEHLLRERGHINNSINSASNIIGQADSIRSDLRFQGRSLRNTSSVLGQLTTNIPGLNHLIEQIRRRRSWDDKVVAGVIAICIVFTLWYIF